MTRKLGRFTFILHRSVTGQTPFGIFTDLNSQTFIDYIGIHFRTLRLEVLWPRMKMQQSEVQQ